MGDDPDSVPEREMKDFQFRQMKKIRVFESSADLPKERSSLLTISNKYGLTFAGRDRTLKVFWTRDVIAAGRLEGNPNDTVAVGVAMHHMALSSDELTLSVCGTGDAAELTLDLYDVRTFFNKDRQEKRPFTSFRPMAAADTLVQDLKWSPVDASRLAVCLSDGSMMVLDVQDSISVVAQLPASAGITCVCWSPKGKQVSAGKEDATVVQFTPTLQAKKVIPCPSFYSQDHPVKVLDVLWLSTYNFAVAYAAADGSLETPPELVVVSLPKKDEKRDERYLNFNDLVYGTCTERQHHYYLCHIEDWDLVLAASAAAIEVSIIAKQEDKVNWELWLLEDASRAELPVTENSEDTLPVGMAIDYTSQEDIHLSDEKRLPPAPTLMLLSTDGVLCPFSLLNLNPAVKQLTMAAIPLPEDGERAPAASKTTAMRLALCQCLKHLIYLTAYFVLCLGVKKSEILCLCSESSSSSSAPVSAASSIFPSFPASFGTAPPPATLSFTAPPPAATVAASSVPPTSVSSTNFSFSLPALSSAGPSGFSLGSTAAGFSFSAPKPSSDAPAFSFTSSFAPKEVSSAPTAIPPQRPPAMSPIISGPKVPVEPATPAVRMNLTDSVFPCVLWQVMSVKALEKHLQQKKESDPIMTGILEEIGHFEKELDDLKTRCRNADFRVGSTDDMKDLRKDSENLHAFTLEIRDTTESLHGDISMLKTSLLEGFAGAEEARAQSELNRDKDYLQLLYKKPLDPRREEQLKEIRHLYQYVKFAMEDVNAVLDMEWEKHVEKKKKKKQRHMIAPEREALFTALANNLDIINQQKQRLDRLESDLHKLRLCRGTSVWSFISQTPSTPSGQSLDSELESLKDSLLKASLETAPKVPAKSPSKQSQLRNFLSKRQTPPVHSTAPANLSRSAFLFPQFYEDLDEVSSSSSLSQPLEPEDSLAVAEEEDEPAPIPVLTPAVPQHPAMVRTPSIQPGFIMQSSPFSRVQTGPVFTTSLECVAAPKINMDSADSTALATKTVKHGAPPTTMPAPQAAGRAALSRHMTSQKPGTNTCLLQLCVKIHIYPPSPPTLGVSPTPPPSVTPPSEMPVPVSEPPAAEPVSDPPPETTSTSTATPLPQETPATTSSSAPVSEKTGSIFAPPSSGTDSLTVGAISLTSVVATAASSIPSAAITSSTAPTPGPVFGQPTSVTQTTAFGSTVFGANSTTSGFGKPPFGQNPSAGFGQPAASGSASSFTFGQPAFSASSGFGQPAAASTTSATSSGGGGLFGSSSANSASSFSFGASGTSSTPSTGTGLFGQSSAPVFGQSSSGFGQGSMFGSNTTTASSGFGFGQQSSGFFFFHKFQQERSSRSLFGSNTGNTSSGSGFFSGLGGKPSEDAANKNPFGSPATAEFGQPINTAGPSNLFGSSGAKGFSFGSSSFGEQKASGSFSSGTGSVAAQGFGSFSTPTKPAGFGGAPVFSSPSTFGGSPAFGGSAGFGSTPSFNSPLGSSSGKVFGEGTTASNVGGFGFGSPQNTSSFSSLAGSSTAAPSFGSLAQQQQQPPPSGFGTQSGAFSGFGSSGGETTRLFHTDSGQEFTGPRHQMLLLFGFPLQPQQD
uniref:Nuclear pore complex protein Nup214 n=1 Tax=Sinocyclocheilus anshuiensis TaxID=1608454 RepID=A0A671MCP3_9TELE